ncbi:envelope protein UL78 [Panine betaherpesvirus 2]|uniref:Envelope protein UL78 n=1 Tax=Panine betaherpesvirus 2 TaxID=188763 RepID=Q8QS21_9BETA|nr:envelope protein UL78 [Panine betaherpesvirus 2]AAM00717.1 envelope protein UL78 [Panine betaherpesvirus 2]QXV67827.1 envelope protein UL78 [Panine betaherpesvirus 2]
MTVALSSSTSLNVAKIVVPNAAMIADRAASDLLTGMFASISVLNLLAIVGCLWMLRVTRPSIAVQVFTWNLVLSQFFSIVATVFSKGMTLSVYNAADLGFCRLALFVEDVGLYSTSLLFLFLILDRLAAIAQGRDLWRHQTRENVSLALYVVAFIWVLSVVAAVPTAATGTIDFRWRGCEIPLQYSGVDLTIKMWFVMGAPMIAVLSYVVDLSYNDKRDAAWPYVGRVCSYYVTCLLLYVPHYCFRVLRSVVEPGDTTFGIMDYMELGTRTVLMLRLSVLPLFIVALFSSNPTQDLDVSLERLLESCSRSGGCCGVSRLLRKLMEMLKRMLHSVELVVRFDFGSTSEKPDVAQKPCSCAVAAPVVTAGVSTTSDKATLVEHVEDVAYDDVPSTTIEVVSAESSSVLCAAVVGGSMPVTGI